MNKRIVIFSAFFEPHFGGVERYVKELSLALTKKGSEVIIITSDTDNIGFYEKFKNISIYRLKHKYFIDGRLPVPYSLIELIKIEKIIIDFNPNVIILNMRIYPLMLFGAFIAKKNNIISILIDHVSGSFQFNSILKSKLSFFYEKVFSKYLKNRVNSFFGVSSKVNDWLKTFSIETNGIIFNGVNENPDFNNDFNFDKYSIKNDKFSIFFAGRLIEEKGIKVLCDAYQKFRKNNTQFIICGDGPLYIELKRQFQNEDFIFLGKTPHIDVMSLLKFSDVAVIPSYYPEGLPTIILEAGICGTAVMTTDSGGAKEVITDKYNGILIQKKSEQSILDNLELLYKDKTLLNMYSKNLNRTIKEKFIWRKIADTLLIEIEKLKN